MRQGEQEVRPDKSDKTSKPIPSELLPPASQAPLPKGSMVFQNRTISNRGIYECMRKNSHSNHHIGFV